MHAHARALVAGLPRIGATDPGGSGVEKANFRAAPRGRTG